ncbi:MAG: transglycosylase SLT domain-containing protein [Bdellovibrionales bacterium]
MKFLQLGFSLTLFGLFLALGCQSKSKKNSQSASDPSAAIRTAWIQDYKKALALMSSAPEQSCALYEGLTADPGFPVKPLAELRRHQVCEKLKSKPVDRQAMPAWLQDLALDVTIGKLDSLEDEDLELDLALEKSKQNLPQSEKIKWTQIALKRAESKGDDEKIKLLQERLYKIAPRLIPQPKAREWLDVAGDFRWARQFEQARQYYEKVVNSGQFSLNEKIAALKGIRLSYKNERRMDDHIKSCQRLMQFTFRATRSYPKVRALTNAYFDAALYYGRALWTAHRAGEARALFLKLEAGMRHKASRAELYWLLGRMAEERGELDEVARYFDLALKEKIRNPELRDKILWYGAWNDRRRGNLEEAARRLNELEAQSPSDFTRVRALFWLGRTQFELKQEDTAKVTLEKLIQLDPVGYYGLLAHRNLEKAIALSPVADDGPKAESLPIELPVVNFLTAVDEKEALADYLDLAAKAYRRQGDQNDNGWTTLFQYYAHAGLYMKLYQSMTNLTPEHRKAVLESHPDLLFPQPWDGEVRSASLQFGVEEELIYAIMRQESAFDTRARSVADAFGLMQVLPEVAEKLSRENSLAYNTMEDLYTPQLNVMVGAAHLKQLMSRYNKQFILAVAAYNANESAIKNWMKTRFRGDALEFIEEIPYEETRTYVRLVMRNMIFYSLLKSKRASIEFPSWVLKLEDAS